MGKKKGNMICRSVKAEFRLFEGGSVRFPSNKMAADRASLVQFEIQQYEFKLDQKVTQ